MTEQFPFKIYDASAGSGKTFSLVKNYLKLLLSSRQREPFKFILALTFTNKAVGEMKNRILKTLEEFSDPDNAKAPSHMFSAISEELHLTSEVLQNKSRQLLYSILHSYGSFDISTIDGFNHRIIRTFAHDLKLSLNFDIELNTHSFLAEAVDNVIAKAGDNDLLTKILVDYAVEKADNDKSWNITKDLNDIATLLLKDNEKNYLETLQNKTLQDFHTFKTNIICKISTIENTIVTHATEIIELLKTNGLEFSDFSNGYLPKHFKKLASRQFDVNFSSKWQENIENKPLYPKKVSENTKITIDALQPKIADTFYYTEKLIFEHRFLMSIAKNITQLSVLNSINKELTKLKEVQNVLFVSDFNTLIANEIKSQPTPFIYERLGEQFKHYFIDEFQDTSIMQWGNLIPLISNTLATQTGTALLVGDAKQAIYRWRGGKAEQFLGLTLNDNPFQIPKHVERLEKNYRSCKTIVSFNNAFFNYLSKTCFSHHVHGKLYELAEQIPNNNSEGFVSIEFLDIENGNDKDELYPEKVYDTITSCLNLGYTLKDICILVRKRKEASVIAEYLNHKKVTIASFESMLLINSPEVTTINTILKLLVQPEEKEERVKLLHFLASQCCIENKHHFFKTHLDLDIYSFFNAFKHYDIHINIKKLVRLPIYELVETIIRDFKLIKTENAYLQYYLDIVFEFSLKETATIIEFIRYFEKNEDKFNIITPEDLDAVRIMTIHKSKGLEFPIVIFPYAELNIYKEINPKIWFPLQSTEYHHFPYALINYNKDIAHFGTTGNDIYHNHQSELELDNINILYVALTRAVEQLYIIGKKDVSNKGIVNTKTYSGMFINFLKQEQRWDNNQLIYNYGSAKRKSQQTPVNSNTEILESFISIPKENHNLKIVTNSGYLWDTSQEKAIEKGNLIHKIMANIITKEDVLPVMDTFFLNHIIDAQQKLALTKTVLELVNNPRLEALFKEHSNVYTEHNIITENGSTLRPDRLNINSHREIVITDYKTGVFKPEYKHQLQHYQDVLETMNYKIIQKILVFITDDIKIEVL